MKKIYFPENFDWGTASSGPQSEGSFDKPHESVWDYWYKQDPDRFFQKVGPKITSNVYFDYETDISIMKEIGLKSFRTSIQWTRLIDDFETGKPNEKAVEFYNNYINCMIENGIEPVMNLFHFDTPIQLEHELDGFKNKEVAKLYSIFAKTAFECFGDRVKRWVTFNEPIGHARGTYLDDTMYPNKQDVTGFFQANYNILLAHALAVTEYRKLNLEGEIGIILDLLPAVPRSDHPLDLQASKMYDLFYNGVYMDPCVNGWYKDDYIKVLEKHNVIFDYTDNEKQIIKDAYIDFVGINFYQPMRVKGRENTPNQEFGFHPNWYYEAYVMPNRRMNEYRGWEIYPKTVYDIATRMKEEYGNKKWFLSENGMGVQNEDRFLVDGMIEDDYRIDFIKEHLEWLSKAIDEGANCFGYHLWTFVDNWSWTNAYRNRYGYVSLDLKTRKRTIKKSGYWIKEVIKDNCFDSLEKQYE